MNINNAISTAHMQYITIVRPVNFSQPKPENLQPNCGKKKHQICGEFVVVITAIELSQFRLSGVGLKLNIFFVLMQFSMTV